VVLLVSRPAKSCEYEDLLLFFLPCFRPEPNHFSNRRIFPTGRMNNPLLCCAGKRTALPPYLLLASRLGDDGRRVPVSFKEDIGGACWGCSSPFHLSAKGEKRGGFLFRLSLGKPSVDPNISSGGERLSPCGRRGSSFSALQLEKFLGLKDSVPLHAK